MSRAGATLSPRLAATAARLARVADIDVDDAKQELELIVVEHACNYDAGRGATRETYYINKLKNWIKDQRAQRRFGIELDSEDVSEAAKAEAVNIDDLDELTDDNRLDNCKDWRGLSDSDALEKIGGFPVETRNVAACVVSEGCSSAETAARLGLTQRRVNQILKELIEFFKSGGVPPLQPTLF